MHVLVDGKLPSCPITGYRKNVYPECLMPDRFGQKIGRLEIDARIVLNFQPPSGMMAYFFAPQQSERGRSSNVLRSHRIAV